MMEILQKLTHTHTHRVNGSLILPKWASVCPWCGLHFSVRCVESQTRSSCLLGPWSHPSIPALPGCPCFPSPHSPWGWLRPPPAHHPTQTKSPSCTAALSFFKNRLGYQPGQLRDLHASWGLRNVSALPRSLISVWILWVIDCVRVCLYLCMCVWAQIV